jgi:hypothetical protein
VRSLTRPSSSRENQDGCTRASPVTSVAFLLHWLGRNILIEITTRPNAQNTTSQRYPLTLLLLATWRTILCIKRRDTVRVVEHAAQALFYTTEEFSVVKETGTPMSWKSEFWRWTSRLVQRFAVVLCRRLITRERPTPPTGVKSGRTCGILPF